NYRGGRGRLRAVGAVRQRATRSDPDLPDHGDLHADRRRQSHRPPDDHAGRRHNPGRDPGRHRDRQRHGAARGAREAAPGRGRRDQNGVVLSSGEVYDSTMRTWAETPGMIPGGRAGHTATLLKQGTPGAISILLVGGVDRGEMPAPAQLYDPSGTGTWTAVSG